jgi:maltokinase-like protein
VNASQQAKETFRELRMTLPPLLARYLTDQRWFGAKARQIRSAEITDLVPLGNARFETLLLLVRLEYTTGPGETYVLPLICTQEPTAESEATGLKIHSPARGRDLHLRNALADHDFLRSLLETIAQEAVFRSSEGEIHAACTSVFHVLCGASPGNLEVLSTRRRRRESGPGNRTLSHETKGFSAHPCSRRLVELQGQR